MFRRFVNFKLNSSSLASNEAWRNCIKIGKKQTMGDKIIQLQWFLIYSCSSDSARSSLFIGVMEEIFLFTLRKFI